MSDAKKPRVSYEVVSPAYAQFGGYGGSTETRYRDWTPEDGVKVRRVEGGFIIAIGDVSRVCGPASTDLTDALFDLFWERPPTVIP